MDGLDLDKYKNILATKTRKPLRAKYQGYSKIGYTKEIYYKLYPELYYQLRLIENNASPIIDILFISYSNLIIQ